MSWTPYKRTPHCASFGSLSALQSEPFNKVQQNKESDIALLVHCSNQFWKQWVMETRGWCLRLRAGILLFYLSLAVVSLTHCDAESMRISKGPKHRSLINEHPKKLRVIRHDVLDPSLQSSDAQPYSISSPNSLPPYESLAPIPLPDNSPPFCVYPPNPPSTTIPTPGGYESPPPPYYYSSPTLPIENPPPSSTGTIPGPPESYPTPTPEIVPYPPSNIPGSPEPGLNPPIIFPSPPESTLNPPYYEPPYNIPSPTGGVVPSPFGSVPSPVGGGGIIPSPPSFVPSPIGGGGIIPSPPTFVPSPGGGGTVPSPTVFQPPVIFPPPSVPPPPNTSPSVALWCVAKPSVPDPIIQEAMSYACGSGADCESIQPNGPCFEPNTVFAHASFAFNSYWQRTKVNRGSCDFGGTAMLVTVDPSYDGCHFDYY